MDNDKTEILGESFQDLEDKDYQTLYKNLKKKHDILRDTYKLLENKYNQTAESNQVYKVKAKYLSAQLLKLSRSQLEDNEEKQVNDTDNKVHQLQQQELIRQNNQLKTQVHGIKLQFEDCQKRIEQLKFERLVSQRNTQKYKSNQQKLEKTLVNFKNRIKQLAQKNVQLSVRLMEHDVKQKDKHDPKRYSSVIQS